MKRVFYCLLVLSLLSQVLIARDFPKNLSREDLDRGILAKACMVYDVKTGQIIYGKNIEKTYPPASVVKMLTAYLAYKRFGLDGFVTVQREDVRVEPSSIPLRVGEVVSVKNLISSLLVSSCNDAAMVLGRETSGSMSEFIKLMNQKAREFGCTNTKFTNPHGLPGGAYTTASDLMKIFKEVLAVPALREIMQLRYYNLYTKVGFQRLKNHNKLMGKLHGMGPSKTGWTRASRHTFACSVTRGGREILITILNSANKWQDTTVLTEYAFQNLPKN